MDRSTALVIIATAVATNLLGALSLWLSHRLQSEREAAARCEQEKQAMRAERRESQRSTLLRLQEVLAAIAWSSVRPESLDSATYGHGRRPFDEVVGKGWSEKLATLAGDLAIIRARVTNSDLAEQLSSLRAKIIFVIDIADNSLDGGEALMSLNERALATLDRVGELLANL